MRRSVLFLALVVPLWTWPPAARAHGLLQGAADFYAGLLHPVVVPAEILAILAVALVAGTAGQIATRWSLVTLAGGIAAGLLLIQFLPTTLSITAPLLVAVAVAAAVVVAGIAVPAPVAAATAAALGLLVGMDARPAAISVGAALVASAATVVGGTLVATIVAASVLGREKHWQRVATRVAASWITAIAVLYFGWLALRLSG